MVDYLSTVHYIALVIVIVGALNWGAVALTKNPDGVLGFLNRKKVGGTNYAPYVYGLVGLSGIFLTGTAIATEIKKKEKK